MRGSTRALPLVADAREGIASLDAALGEYRAPVAWKDLSRIGARNGARVLRRRPRQAMPGYRRTRR